MIPYGKQDINQSDIDAVVEVLNSDFLTQGDKTKLFESSISSYTKSEYSVAVNSATSALHIACLALNLKKGDWLWTSPNSFVASANCGLYCGAKVDFVDIELSTYNMCEEALEVKLIKAKKDGRLPKIVIPVHFAGQSCNMKRIYALSLIYGFSIIEDASHAIGGQYLSGYIGGCKYSDITVFSFHPVKIITTAEGGVATTNSEVLFNKMQLSRSHGITRNQKFMDKESDGAWFYQQIDLGFNYRMTELQAALGVSQMNRLDEFINKRQLLRKRYDELLVNLPIVRPHQNINALSACHLYPILIETSKTNKSRKTIFNELRLSGISVNLHYIPIHTQPYYRQQGFKTGDFPNSEKYYSKAISIPIFSAMDFKVQDKVVKSIKRLFQ